jgi:hypothetical protein
MVFDTAEGEFIAKFKTLDREKGRVNISVAIRQFRTMAEGD